MVKRRDFIVLIGALILSHSCFADDRQKRLEDISFEALTGAAPDYRGERHNNWQVVQENTGSFAILSIGKNSRQPQIPKAFLPDSYKNYPGDWVGIQISAGWVVSLDRGEWGGSVFWISEAGVSKKIFSKPFRLLYSDHDRLFGIYSLQHLNISESEIYEVEIADSAPRIKFLRQLPEAIAACLVWEEGRHVLVSSRSIMLFDASSQTINKRTSAIWKNLQPNSIIFSGKFFYVGLSNGVARVDASGEDWSMAWGLGK